VQRLELQKHLEFKKYKTKAQLRGEHEALLQRRHFKLWASSKKNAKKRSMLIQIFTFWYNHIEGMHHLWVPKPFLAYEREDIMKQVGYYIPEHILTQTFIVTQEESVSDSSQVNKKRRLSDVYATYCAMSTKSKKTLKAAMAPGLQLIECKRQLSSGKTDKYFEFYKQILFARSGDIVLISPHLENPFAKTPRHVAGWDKKSVSRFQREAHRGKLVKFTSLKPKLPPRPDRPDRPRRWRMHVRVTNEGDYVAGGDEEEEDEEPASKILIFKLIWLEWVLIRKDDGDDFSQYTAALKYDDQYKWRSMFNRLMMPRLLKLPDLVLIRPLINIVFSFCVGGNPPYPP